MAAFQATVTTPYILDRTIARIQELTAALEASRDANELLSLLLEERKESWNRL
jgi:hypothetical protein